MFKYTVSLSTVWLKQDWNGLDYNVSESYDKSTDESCLLLLCDDCNISYYTAYLQRPLD
jgi:hypothetical protein